MSSASRYRQSKKGLIAYLYAAQRHRSKKKGWPMPDYSLTELRDRLVGEPHFNYLYAKWVRGGRVYYDKPSLDRIDPTKPYTLSNIRITNWKANRQKGDAEKHLVTGTAVRMLDMRGKELRSFDSVKEAVMYSGCHSGLIIAVCQGKRNHTGGYKWEYCGRRRCKDDSHYKFENPELLK